MQSGKSAPKMQGPIEPGRTTAMRRKWLKFSAYPAAVIFMAGFLFMGRVGAVT